MYVLHLHILFSCILCFKKHVVHRRCFLFFSLKDWSSLENPFHFHLKKFSPSLTGPWTTMVMNTSKIFPYFSGSMNKCVLPKLALTVSAIHRALNGMPLNSHWLRRRLKCLRQLSAINHSRILSAWSTYCLKAKMRHFDEVHRMSLTLSLQ
jgi:hypothetical protein